MSTQNQQYQQALANYRASQIPLNSSSTVNPSCCVRTTPIPVLPINIASGYQITNSQSGNDVGTFYAYGCGNLTGLGTSCVPPALGYTAADNPSYLSLRVKRQYRNSRLRFINEPNPWSGATDTTTNFNYFNSAKFTARANLEYFNFTKWNFNYAFFGFYSGSHATTTPLNYNLETGLVFRPNQYGNWRCSWFCTTNSLYASITADPNNSNNSSEQAFIDTDISTSEVHDFKIILENNNTTCTWYIDDSPVFNVDINSGISQDVTGLLYSAFRKDESVTNAYAGCEVRQRTTTGLEESNQDFRINLYNSEFSVIYPNESNITTNSTTEQIPTIRSTSSPRGQITSQSEISLNCQVVNSQSENSVGTFYAYGCGNQNPTNIVNCSILASGYTAADNPSYLSLRVRRQYTTSRLRFINEPNPWSGGTDTTTNFNYFNSAKFTARANLEYFNFTKWNSNYAFFGFYSGSHSGGLFSNLYKLETGLIFRPNNKGNWRCSWFGFTESMFENGNDISNGEQAFIDTNISTLNVHDFKIILENNNTICTWYIDDSPVFNVDINSGISQDVTGLLYSALQDVGRKSTAYAGAEVRQRTTTGLEESDQDFRINLYNSEFCVIY